MAMSWRGKKHYPPSSVWIKSWCWLFACFACFVCVFACLFFGWFGSVRLGLVRFGLAWFGLLCVCVLFVWFVRLVWFIWFIWFIWFAWFGLFLLFGLFCCFLCLCHCLNPQNVGIHPFGIGSKALWIASFDGACGIWYWIRRSWACGKLLNFRDSWRGIDGIDVRMKATQERNLSDMLHLESRSACTSNIMQPLQPLWPSCISNTTRMRQVQNWTSKPVHGHTGLTEIGRFRCWTIQCWSR